GDFVGYMNNLGLPHPKLMDVAVPANLHCGEPQGAAPPPDEPSWGPLTFPFVVCPRRLDELSRDRPVVAVCRSGARSAQASVLLSKSGFPRVANLAGGMLRWRGEGQPVDGGRE